jgi:predicted hydrocarbon binding protein
MNHEGPDPEIGLEEIKNTLEKADQELSENLRLFAERIMLYRITKSEEKNDELGIFARILLEVGTLGENPEIVLSDISGIESLAKEKLTVPEVSNLFSTMVQATEKLDSKQLYYLLEKLRTEPMEAIAEPA